MKATLKQACAEQLIYAQAEDRLFFYCIEGSHADFIVIQKGQVHLEYMGKQKGPVIPVSFVTFIKCGNVPGKKKPEQFNFYQRVTEFNCQYHVIRSVSELQEVLKRE